MPRSDNPDAHAATDWLSLAAAPAFGFMALLTGVLGGGSHEVLCSAASHTSALGGMVPMYALMAAFHLAPWRKIIATTLDGRHAAGQLQSQRQCN